MNLKGRVVQSTGSWYKVAPTKGGDIIDCRLPGRFRQAGGASTNPVAVGDIVVYVVNQDGSGAIETIEDRKNYIIRNATHGRQGHQILASNVDQAIVVQSIKKPKLREGFIDRFLVACEAYQLQPVIIINKKDLANEQDSAYTRYLTGLYQSLGYQLLTSSIYEQDSLAVLKKQLQDKTSAFIGPSGVGKTSLLNHLDPAINRPVKPISDYSNKGTHTTTYARLLPLCFGGFLVDTPGIREFGLVNIEPWELSLFFPEMLEPRTQCKFNNCTHSHEPHCGVQNAFEEGSIDASRYQSYLQMLDSLEEQ